MPASVLADQERKLSKSNEGPSVRTALADGKVKCECGGIYFAKNKAKHLATKAHKKWVNKRKLGKKRAKADSTTKTEGVSLAPEKEEAKQKGPPSILTAESMKRFMEYHAAMEADKKEAEKRIKENAKKKKEMLENESERARVQYFLSCAADATPSLNKTLGSLLSLPASQVPPALIDELHSLFPHHEAFISPDLPSTLSPIFPNLVPALTLNPSPTPPLPLNPSPISALPLNLHLSPPLNPSPIPDISLKPIPTHPFLLSKRRIKRFAKPTTREQGALAVLFLVCERENLEWPLDLKHRKSSYKAPGLSPKELQGWLPETSPEGYLKRLLNYFSDHFLGWLVKHSGEYAEKVLDIFLNWLQQQLQKDLPKLPPEYTSFTVKEHKLGRLLCVIVFPHLYRNKGRPKSWPTDSFRGCEK